MKFLRLLLNEIKKIKGTWTGYLSIIVPILLVSLLVLAFWLRAGNNSNFWNSYTTSVLQMWYLLMLPLYVGIQTALYAALEHNANTWKILFTLPVKRYFVYLSKLVVSLILVIISQVTLLVSIILGAFILNLFRPDYQILSTIPNLNNLVIALTVPIIATIGIIFLDTYLSMRIKTFAAPLVLSVVAILPNIIGLISYKPFLFISPWIMPFNVVGNLRGVQNPSIIYSLLFSLILGSIVILLGVIDYKKLDIY